MFIAGLHSGERAAAQQDFLTMTGFATTKSGTGLCLFAFKHEQCS